MDIDATITRPALRFHGSQFLNAPWIAQYMPAHETRVIPFMGGLNEEIRFPRAKLTNATDKDGRIINFFTILRDCPDKLIRAIRLTPWHYGEYELSRVPAPDPLEDARRFWCACWMSVVGGPNPGKSGFRWTRSRDGRWSTPATDSLNIDHLYDVATRLRHIHFIQGDAIALIDRHAGVANALIWCDPPFLKETRISGLGTYKHETSIELHQATATALHKCVGYALITGYGWNKDGGKNEVYEELYEQHGWRRVDSERRVNGGGSRPQSLWISPRTWQALETEQAEREAEKQRLAEQAERESLPLLAGIDYE